MQQQIQGVHELPRPLQNLTKFYFFGYFHLDCFTVTGKTSSFPDVLYTSMRPSLAALKIYRRCSCRVLANISLVTVVVASVILCY